ncbi:MutS-related protein [Actinocorallia lasiicapitis]
MAGEPEFFRDLNLDQVGEGLGGWFWSPVRDVTVVVARQAVFRELEDGPARAAADRFTAVMARTRTRSVALARMTHPPQADRWFLEIVLDWADAVAGFADGLAAAEVTSAGLAGVGEDLAGFVRSGWFTGLRERGARLRERLAGVRYEVLMRADRITVAAAREDGEPDFAERVVALFDRFRWEGAPPAVRPQAGDGVLDQVDAAVLDLVAGLHPEVFDELGAFRAAFRDFLPEPVVRLDRELTFFLGYLRLLAPLRSAGLPVCYPDVSATVKELDARGVYDLALAVRLVSRGGTVVGNDVRLDGAERILVVSGPNQGGKTTLSRTFGQLHHLAALGCPVPGRRVRLFLPDRILTHYERPELPGSLVSKLEDDLRRLAVIFERATGDSLLILNEIFTSTTADDARALSERVLARISGLDAVCLWVSFVDDLALGEGKAVSMVSTVAEQDRTTRTFRVVRRPADGRAYASSLADKHGLTYDRLTARIRR